MVVSFHDEIHEFKRTYRPEIVQQKARERADEILNQLQQGPGSLLRQVGRRWATARESLARKAGLGPSSDPAVVTREGWILDQLAKLSKGERLLALQKAVEIGDSATVRAALNCPSTFAIVDDATAEQVRQEYHAKHLPEEAAAYKSMHEDHLAQEENFATAERCVREIAGMVDGTRERIGAPEPSREQAMRERLEAAQAAQE